MCHVRNEQQSGIKFIYEIHINIKKTIKTRTSNQVDSTCINIYYRWFVLW